MADLVAQELNPDFIRMETSRGDSATVTKERMIELIAQFGLEDAISQVKESLVTLLDWRQSDMAKIGIEWDGDTETFTNLIWST